MNSLTVTPSISTSPTIYDPSKVFFNDDIIKSEPPKNNTFIGYLIENYPISIIEQLITYKDLMPMIEAINSDWDYRLLFHLSKLTGFEMLKATMLKHRKKTILSKINKPLLRDEDFVKPIIN